MQGKTEDERALVQKLAVAARYGAPSVVFPKSVTWTDALAQALVCPVCLDVARDVVIGTCGHPACAEHAAMLDTCPLCAKHGAFDEARRSMQLAWTLAVSECVGQRVDTRPCILAEMMQDALYTCSIRWLEQAF